MFQYMEDSKVSQRNHQSKLRRRRSSSPEISPGWVVAAVVVFLAVPFSHSFSVDMTYRPPVKTSVQKLYDQRLPSDRQWKSTSQTSSKSAYAGVFAPQTSPISPAASFERRMRELVLSAPQPRPMIDFESRPRGLPPNVLYVETLSEYKKVVGDEKEKIVAVRFFATYCKACKAVAPHFYKLAKKYPDVIFVDVPVTPKNAALHQGLGVPSLPFAHIYHPQEGLVEELKLTRKHIENFAAKLDSYVKNYCELSEDWDKQTEETDDDYDA